VAVAPFGFSGITYILYIIEKFKGFLLPSEGSPALGLYSPPFSPCAFVLSLTVLL